MGLLRAGLEGARLAALENPARQAGSGRPAGKPRSDRALGGGRAALADGLDHRRGGAGVSALVARCGRERHAAAGPVVGPGGPGLEPRRLAGECRPAAAWEPFELIGMQRRKMQWSFSGET